MINKGENYSPFFYLYYMKSKLKLATVAGIDIFIHWTFLLLIGFIVYTNKKAGYNQTQIAWSVLFISFVFITVLLHELGHAMAARRFNIKTRDITLLPIGGLARLEKMPEKPWEELVVAIAGPAVNIVLAAITSLFISIPEPEAFIEQLSNGVNASNFFLNFFVVNLVLAFFNLLPAFPMDGGRVFRALLSLKLKRTTATNIAAMVGQFVAVLFVLFGFKNSPTLIFIGIFIFLGARSEAKYTEMDSLLKGFKVKDILMQQFQKIDASEPIRNAVSMLLNGQIKNFLVIENNKVAGTLSRDDIIKCLNEGGNEALVSSAMNKNLLYVDANWKLAEAWKKIQEHDAAIVPVHENGAFVGVLDTENILEFIMVRQAEEA